MYLLLWSCCHTKYRSRKKGIVFNSKKTFYKHNVLVTFMLRLIIVRTIKYISFDELFLKNNLNSIPILWLKLKIHNYEIFYDRPIWLPRPCPAPPLLLRGAARSPWQPLPPPQPPLPPAGQRPPRGRPEYVWAPSTPPEPPRPPAPARGSAEWQHG